MKSLFLSLLVSFSFALQAQEHIHYHWVALMNEDFTLESGETTYFWGFGPQATMRATLPGPLIEANQFDTISVHMLNLSPEAHTIHLHGLDVDTPNDGVPHTSFSVIPNDSATYTFVADHHGTFLYHCHVMTTLHLAMGMYGMVVIHPPEPNILFPEGPEFDGEYNYLFSEMNSAWNDNQLSPGPFHLYEADVFLVNGFFQSTLDEEEEQHVFADPGDNVLLRLGNVAYSKVTVEIPVELNVTTYMSDGRILPETLTENTIELYSGERFSLILSSDQPFYGDISVQFEDVRDETQIGELFIPVSIDEGLHTDDIVSEPNLLWVNHPFSDAVRLTSDRIYQDLQILSIDGRVIQTGITINPGYNTLHFDAPPGMYLLRGSDFAKKFVVVR